jgi:hypothetical protein
VTVTGTIEDTIGFPPNSVGTLAHRPSVTGQHRAGQEQIGVRAIGSCYKGMGRAGFPLRPGLKSRLPIVGNIWSSQVFGLPSPDISTFSSAHKPAKSGDDNFIASARKRVAAEAFCCPPVLIPNLKNWNQKRLATGWPAAHGAGFREHGHCHLGRARKRTMMFARGGRTFTRKIPASGVAPTTAKESACGTSQMSPRRSAGPR